MTIPKLKIFLLAVLLIICNIICLTSATFISSTPGDGKCIFDLSTATATRAHYFACHVNYHQIALEWSSIQDIPCYFTGKRPSDALPLDFKVLNFSPIYGNGLGLGDDEASVAVAVSFINDIIPTGGSDSPFNQITCYIPTTSLWPYPATVTAIEFSDSSFSRDAIIDSTNPIRFTDAISFPHMNLTLNPPGITIGSYTSPTELTVFMVNLGVFVDGMQFTFDFKQAVNSYSLYPSLDKLTFIGKCSNREYTFEEVYVDDNNPTGPFIIQVSGVDHNLDGNLYADGCDLLQFDIVFKKDKLPSLDYGVVILEVGIIAPDGVTKMHKQSLSTHTYWSSNLDDEERLLAQGELTITPGFIYPTPAVQELVDLTLNVATLYLQLPRRLSIPQFDSTLNIATRLYSVNLYTRPILTQDGYLDAYIIGLWSTAPGTLNSPDGVVYQKDVPSLPLFPQAHFNSALHTIAGAQCDIDPPKLNPGDDTLLPQWLNYKSAILFNGLSAYRQQGVVDDTGAPRDHPLQYITYSTLWETSDGNQYQEYFHFSQYYDKTVNNMLPIVGNITTMRQPTTIKLDTSPVLTKSNGIQLSYNLFSYGLWHMNNTIQFIIDQVPHKRRIFTEPDFVHKSRDFVYLNMLNPNGDISSNSLMTCKLDIKMVSFNIIQSASYSTDGQPLYQHVFVFQLVQISPTDIPLGDFILNDFEVKFVLYNLYLQIPLSTTSTTNSLKPQNPTITVQIIEPNLRVSPSRHGATLATTIYQQQSLDSIIFREEKNEYIIAAKIQEQPLDYAIFPENNITHPISYLPPHLPTNLYVTVDISNILEKWIDEPSSRANQNIITLKFIQPPQFLYNPNSTETYTWHENANWLVEFGYRCGALNLFNLTQVYTNKPTMITDPLTKEQIYVFDIPIDVLPSTAITSWATCSPTTRELSFNGLFFKMKIPIEINRAAQRTEYPTIWSALSTYYNVDVIDQDHNNNNIPIDNYGDLQTDLGPLGFIQFQVPQQGTSKEILYNAIIPAPKTSDILLHGTFDVLVNAKSIHNITSTTPLDLRLPIPLQPSRADASRVNPAMGRINNLTQFTIDLELSNFHYNYIKNYTTHFALSIVDSYSQNSLDPLYIGTDTYGYSSKVLYTTFVTNNQTQSKTLLPLTIANITRPTATRSTYIFSYTFKLDNSTQFADIRRDGLRLHIMFKFGDNPYQLTTTNNNNIPQFPLYFHSAPFGTGHTGCSSQCYNNGFCDEYTNTCMCPYDTLTQSAPFGTYCQYNCDVSDVNKKQCNACKTRKDIKSFNWGETCDFKPKITNFMYYPLSLTQNNHPFDTQYDIPFNISSFSTANDKIKFDMNYVGSPFNMITIIAHSLTSFQPFGTSVVIASIPAVSPVTTFIYDLKSLGYTRILQNLSFTAHIANITTASFKRVVSSSSSSNTIPPENSTVIPQEYNLIREAFSITTTPRCLEATTDPNDPLIVQYDDLCQNNGICNINTGYCECDKSTIWQLGDFCDKSICTTLQCNIDNTLPISQPATTTLPIHQDICFIDTNTTTTSYPLGKPTCNCNNNFTDSTCNTPTSCTAQFTPLQCPRATGIPQFITDDDNHEDGDMDNNNQCECKCKNHYTTANNGSGPFCTRCELTTTHCRHGSTLNPHSQCRLCNCATDRHGIDIYFGSFCECKGISLKFTTPVTSAVFNIIRQQRIYLDELLEITTPSPSNTTNDDNNDNDDLLSSSPQIQLRENNGNLLSLLQYDNNPSSISFQTYLKSILVSLLIDNEHILQRYNLYDTRLFINDTTTKPEGQYVINYDSILNIVTLRNFQVHTTTNTNDNNNNNNNNNNPNNGDDDDDINYSVSYNLVIFPDQCYDGRQLIDDSMWYNTLQNLYNVGNFLSSNNNNNNNNDNTSNNGGGIDAPIISIIDPECNGITCREGQRNSNSASTLSSITNKNTIMLFVLLILVNVIFQYK